MIILEYKTSTPKVCVLGAEIAGAYCTRTCKYMAEWEKYSDHGKIKCRNIKEEKPMEEYEKTDKKLTLLNIILSANDPECKELHKYIEELQHAVQDKFSAYDFREEICLKSKENYANKMIRKYPEVHNFLLEKGFIKRAEKLYPIGGIWADKNGNYHYLVEEIQEDGFCYGFKNVKTFKWDATFGLFTSDIRKTISGNIYIEMRGYVGETIKKAKYRYCPNATIKIDENGG